MTLLEHGEVYRRYEHGPGLGRNLWLDARSLGFMVERDASQMAQPLANRLWDRVLPILDQGDLGACTANAGAGALGTQPYWDKVGHRVVANDARRAEAYAVELYAAATVADGYPGVYPPEDTGSSGLAVCKVLRTRRTISGYRWASSAYGLLRLLQDGPVLMGMPWWQAFSETNGAGFIDSGRWRSSSLEGGHEVEIIGCEINQRDVGNSVLTCCNSWSTSWGDSGFFRLRLKTYTALDEVDLKQFVV